MKYLLIAVLLLLLLGVWAAATRQKLAALDRNVDHAMCQLTLLLTSRADAVLSLLALAEKYGAQAAGPLAERLRGRCRELTARSLPEEVLAQENLLSAACRDAMLLAGQRPDMQSDPDYAQYTGVMDSCARMLRTGHLIYNDSAARLNSALRRFPTRLIAGLLGFHRRGLLDAA